MNPHLDHPFHFDERGRTAATSDADHALDLIKQLLLTDPGERVNRPTFGGGLRRMVFEPNSTQTAATLQFTNLASLQEWLGHRIEISEFEVTAEEAELRVHLVYRLRQEQETRQGSFTQALSPG